MPVAAARKMLSNVSLEKRRPTSGKPRKRKKSWTTSGVLRKNSTYAAPSQRSGAAGEMRSSATAVPMTSAPARPSAEIWIVTQRPPKKRSGNWKAIAPGTSRWRFAPGAPAPAPPGSPHGSRSRGGGRPQADPPDSSAQPGDVRGAEPPSTLWAGLLVARHGRDVLLVELAPGPVLDHPGEPGVDEGDEALAVTVLVLLDADAVRLVRERLPDDLGVRVHLHEAEKDRLVGRDRVRLALLEGEEARGVAVEEQDLRRRVRLRDVLLARRSALGADRLRAEVCGLLDRVVGLLHEDALAGDAVDVGEVDLGLALLRDRERLDDDVRLVVGERGDPGRRHDRHPFDELVDVVLRPEDRLRELAAEVGVEPLPFAGRRILHAERWVVLLRADPQPALRLDRVLVRRELELRRARLGARGGLRRGRRARAAAGRGEDDRQCDPDGACDAPHVPSFRRSVPDDLAQELLRALLPGRGEELLRR